MRVLSLFDGISCGMVALERAGISIDSYQAFEIDQNAIFISNKNYPSIKHYGDVRATDFKEFEGKIDLQASGLFFDFVRALYDCKPKWFLLENNATMSKENQDTISSIVGVEPIYINSNLLSTQDRKRLYWTNIPGIEKPEDKGLFLRDIVQPVSEKREYNIYKRMLDKKEGTLAYKKAWSQIRTLDQKSRALTTSQSISNSGATNVKYSDTEYYSLTPLECERLQTLPDNYTEGICKTARYKAVGNGWTVDVIAHIFKALKVAIDNNATPLTLNRIERPERSYFNLNNTNLKQEIKTAKTAKRATIKSTTPDTDTKSNNNEVDLLELIKLKEREIENIKAEINELKIKWFDKNMILDKEA
jgi:DNA (cytosine-5)-methyltransferase 3A